MFCPRFSRCTMCWCFEICIEPCDRSPKKYLEVPVVCPEVEVKYMCLRVFQRKNILYLRGHCFLDLCQRKYFEVWVGLAELVELRWAWLDWGELGWDGVSWAGVSWGGFSWYVWAGKS